MRPQTASRRQLRVQDSPWLLSQLCGTGFHLTEERRNRVFVYILKCCCDFFHVAIPPGIG